MGVVYGHAEQVVGSGVPVLERFGVSDDDALAVGYTCGGILNVYVKVDRITFPELGDVAAGVEAGRQWATATVVAHLDPDRVDRRLIVRPEEADRSRTGSLGGERSAGLRWDRLRVRGRADRLRPRLPGRRLRRAVDLRDGSALPSADEVVVDWPQRYLPAEVSAGWVDRRNVFGVLTHNPKFYLPLLKVALRLPLVT